MAAEPSPAKASAADGDNYTRLHITPLDHELVKIVIPASVLPGARNMSFHTLETFPEKRYGFVDLPEVEAEKLRKKLHGATLKGCKVRIEKARPEKRAEPAGDADAESRRRKVKSKDDLGSTMKRKRDHNVLQGFVLEGRKVKRGWTEPADAKRRNRKSKDKPAQHQDQEKRRRQKSTYTEQDECLLKTRLPPNAVRNLPVTDAYKKKKKKGNIREVTVHEFEKTTKFPGFLKNTAPEMNGKPAAEFVQGKGWVDEDGNVVETVKQIEPPATTPKREKSSKEETSAQERADGDDTSSSGTSSAEAEERQGSSSDGSEAAEAEQEHSESSGEDDTSSDDSSAGETETPASIPTNKREDTRPVSSSSSRSLSIKIPPPPATPSASKVHPLEALYKRARPAEAAAAQEPQPFSFFGSGGGGDDADEDDIDDEAAPVSVPMTPYTRQDFEWRKVRSAAPTPDTAHPSRSKNFLSSQEDDADVDHAAEDEQGEDGDEAGGGAPSQGRAGSSDFQTWFWENRRDLNKSWMGRRKSAAKEKRHKENRARASKAV
ncbi:uncharacterized protein MAM_00661 [Metarhizium album ARSEF 1941]|uniref:Nucleotide-binding, alpha-beta plait n=1 Tax=Metarhizium album (strain ARSEF 1941) TaxID=1081103 RepID=A0A0B2X830_METAS|nr:uncharacterized protein MAM_00661 [Metarhizium album ARSEF 1941]KHO01660.1 hypothetical protein MAM_00661 [Metarhizium album ARSEF 1941]